MKKAVSKLTRLFVLKQLIAIMYSDSTCICELHEYEYSSPDLTVEVLELSLGDELDILNIAKNLDLEVHLSVDMDNQCILIKIF